MTRSRSLSSSTEENDININPKRLVGKKIKREEEDQTYATKRLRPRYGGVNNYRLRMGFDSIDNSTVTQNKNLSEDNIFSSRTFPHNNEAPKRNNVSKRNIRAVYGKSSPKNLQNLPLFHSSASCKSSDSRKKKNDPIKFVASNSDESDIEIPKTFKPPCREFLDPEFATTSKRDVTGNPDKPLIRKFDSTQSLKRLDIDSTESFMEESNAQLPNFKVITVDNTPQSSSEANSSVVHSKDKDYGIARSTTPSKSFKAYLDLGFDESPISSYHVSKAYISDEESPNLGSSGLISILASKPPLALCPMCYEPVGSDELREYGPMNTRKQEKFCLSHRIKTAKENWTSNRYPSIEWDLLDARVSNHHGLIQRLITGETSYYRALLQEKVDQGKDRNLRTMTSNLIPGYYGPRGLRIISENIFREFTPLLKEYIIQDRLMAARGYTPYVQSVLVPEVAARLITEDLQITLPEARRIMAESASVGELLHEETRDVIHETVSDHGNNPNHSINAQSLYTDGTIEAAYWGTYSISDSSS